MDINYYRKRITELVLDGEEYPTMQGLIDSCQDLDGFAFAELFMEMLQMQEEGKIMYDAKNDNWIWVEPSEKMKEMLKDCKRVL